MKVINTHWSWLDFAIIETTNTYTPYVVAYCYDRDTQTWAWAVGYYKTWEEAKAAHRAKMNW